MKPGNRKSIYNNQPGSDYEGIIHNVDFVLSEKDTKFTRLAYTFMQVLGDVGGVIQITILFCNWLLYPVNYNISGI